MATVLEKILRVGEGRTLKKLERLAKTVEDLEPSFEALSDEELRGETEEFRERLENGETLDDLLPEAFAAVREAARRTIGLHPFHVQVMGGANLHLGNISEMKTGEGKTLVATMPAYLNALAGKGVHIITVNDYLASYQSELMGRVFRALGMTTGCIVAGQDPTERRKQYNADITYGTNNEFGFDYLRDNMASSAAERVQREHYFAIIDEVDSILIDEARTPLIISGPSSGEGNRWFGEFARIAKTLVPEVDYEVDEKKRTVGVLESGIEKVEDYLGITNLYESVNTPLISFLNNSIKAKALFTRDKDYVVLNGEVLIVDEHTGRILAGRRYNEGMHQAIEAKEGVQVKAENQMLATVTLQNYFRLYKKLSGMTGTAETEASEFMSTYKLGVVPIPTNRPMQRVDQPDLVYKNEEAKFAAVVEDIVERHRAGQPVLVGTTSVEKSEYLSRNLAKAGVRHEVLNAKNHAREASIIAQAGRLGAVTVATNMAGRGTDIMLGGNAEFLTVQEMTARGFSTEEDPEAYEEAWDGVFEAVKAAVSEEAAKVTEAGGLYVLGTERHESRRIDNQLRGRSGRQGDPGESRFYLSLADDLMRLFNSGAAAALMNRDSFPDDLAIESKMVTRSIQSAQSQVESRNAEIRKNVLKYDDVLDRQRKAIYSDRAQILDGEDIQNRVTAFREQTIDAILESHGSDENWDFDALWSDLKQLYPIGLTVDEVVAEAGTRVTQDFLRREITSDAEVAYAKREETLGEDAMRELERRVVLTTIDRRWRDHLYEMDYLKEGIGLRAMAQRDPLVEYQREGYTMFESMMGQIKEEATGLLYNLEVQVRPAVGPQDHVHLEGGGLDEKSGPDAAQLSYSAPDEDGSTAMSGAGAQEARAQQARAQQARAQQARAQQNRAAKQQPAVRGAFGQQVEGDEAPEPANRAERRAKKKK
ncbi:preprotein translocase subunit SecA [Leucobacter denitrificans]|uniref:Protein translocase subunit SecA n=1 Tax=Leucobacter denitrificans TaxID=683042 RepID=A0A7G9S3P6_9MICO|nr:preprotein translocase subunit SecA [Leucobacter denitrificans]QNN62471.1 preprotein translocase subunit SecA [Leucobacter denitrificans]